MPASPTPPVIWILATGTEILQGGSTDRNSPWLSGRLLSLGLPTARHLTIADDAPSLRAALTEAAASADLVLITGGLGPTQDDLNRQIIADTWGRDLVESAEALDQIKAFFRKRGRRITDANRCQALLPEGALLLRNDHGTAPGFFIDPVPGIRAGIRASIAALPGPPRENQPMFEAQLLPLIRERFATEAVPATVRTLRTWGLPEAEVNARLRDLFGADPLANLALLFSLSGVDVRLTFTAPPDRLAALEAHWSDQVTRRLGSENFYSLDGREMAEVIGSMLRGRGQTLALAESCTGGGVAERITAIPGSSDYLLEGFVTYSNNAKTQRLGVDPGLIDRHGAVSEPVAEAMARGAREAAGADWAVSITGIAGPGGGSDDKPVGLVCFGLSAPDGTVRSVRRRFGGGREEVRARAAQTALDLVRRALLGVPLEIRLPEPVAG